MKRLFVKYKENMRITDIYEIDEEELVKEIKEVNYRQQKAKYIKGAAKEIVEKNKGEMFRKLEDIVKLKGVGKKIGILVMQSMFKENVGIAVDTHVHKISNRLQWVDSTNPERTRLQLQHLIPRHSWPSVNSLLVGFGQTICKTKPLCS